MATAIIRPTGHINHTSSSADIDNIANLYDNNLTTYSKFSSTTSVGILTNFDTSTISSQIQKITSIKFCLNYTQGSGTKPRARGVYGATSTTKYTECGDSNQNVSNLISGNDYYCELPGAVTFWNKKLSEFMNGGFQIRLYSGNTGDVLYEAYAIIEYEVPMITVSTVSSPAEGGTVTGGGTYESGSTVTATATPNTGYAFSHWLINGANAGSNNPISGALTSDTTVTAVFEKLKYTVRWYNEDGKLLETDTTEYGVMPTYDGVTPTKASTAQYTYTFKGWHIEVATVTASIDYYARYTETTNKYTVLWKNDDGTVLEVDTTEYGKLPTYDSVTPTKPSTVQYTYTFLGWDTTIEEVTRDVVYTAVYTQDVNIYTVEGLSNEGGYVVGGGSCAYGATTMLTAKPYDGYKFVSWSDGYIYPSRSITVTGNATYTAIFEKVETSKIYKGINTVSVYRGNKKVSVYIGTNKIT